MTSSVSCPDADALRRFADRLLDSELHQQLSDHLLGCESCRGVLAGIAASDKQTQELANDEAAQSAPPTPGERLAETRAFEVGHDDVDDDLDLSFLKPSGNDRSLGRR